MTELAAGDWAEVIEEWGPNYDSTNPKLGAVHRVKSVNAIRGAAWLGVRLDVPQYDSVEGCLFKSNMLRKTDPPPPLTESERTVAANRDAWADKCKEAAEHQRAASEYERLASMPLGEFKGHLAECNARPRSEWNAMREELGVARRETGRLGDALDAAQQDARFWRERAAKAARQADESLELARHAQDRTLELREELECQRGGREPGPALWQAQKRALPVLVPEPPPPDPKLEAQLEQWMTEANGWHKRHSQLDSQVRGRQLVAALAWLTMILVAWVAGFALAWGVAL